MEYQVLAGVFVCRACGHVARGEAGAAERVSALEVCRLALRFYADESNYTGALPVLADGGRLAREALELSG